MSAIPNSGVNTVAAKFGTVFKGLKGTKPTADAVYFAPGRYWVRLDKCGLLETRKNGDGLIVSTTVIKVLEEVPGKSHMVGETPGRLFLRKDDYFAGDIVAFVGAIFGVDPTTVGEEEAMAVFDNNGDVVRNMVVEVHAREITTKKNTLFTKIAFRRQVPPAEVLEALTDDEKARYFPNQYLEKMIESLNAQG